MTVDSSLGSLLSALVPQEPLSTLVNLIPLGRQPDGRIDDADHTVGLHEIPPQLSRLGVDILRQQAVRIAVSEHLLEQRPRFILSAHRGESVDVPESADDECVLGRAEIILLGIPEDEVAALEATLYCA